MPELEAGRALDIEVGKALGFGVATATFPRVWDYEIAVDGEDEARLLPHYSTRIEDAWQVIEKLREQGIRLAILPDRLGNGWSVTLLPQGFLPVFAETAPLAVCRAALQVAESLTTVK